MGASPPFIALSMPFKVGILVFGILTQKDPTELARSFCITLVVRKMVLLHVFCLYTQGGMRH